MSRTIPRADGARDGRPVSKARTPAADPTKDPRWAAFVARDARADGTFFYGVASTGIYCRPSCMARRARPENVTFHATAADAQRAGFRACRRCRPDAPPLAQRQAATIATLCRFIESRDQPPSLQTLARRAGLSVFHLHRVFRAVTGVTPKGYAAAHRTRRVRRALRESPTVTAAIYEAGYSSNGRFYEGSKTMLGMTPTQYRSGAPDSAITFATRPCSLGSVLVASTEQGVCAILLGPDPEALTRDLERRFPRASLSGGDERFQQVVADVVTLVERPGASADLPLDIRGTAFQRRVWEVLRTIPAGTTATYGDVARALGAPRAVRAVAQACAANALAVAIPCHRVIRSDGTLSGYRWGIDRKRALLDRESGR